MRKVAVIALVVMASVVFLSTASAENDARGKCVAKCKEAVQLINDKGLDAALAVINSKDGGFAWGDSYLFVVDFQGKQVASGFFPNYNGMNIIDMKNKDGRMVIREFIDIAKTKGEGWLEYMWPKPEEMSKPPDQRIYSKKASHVLRVPGQDMFVVAGVHE
ncbi:MAG TPA: cache domain-containing protein [Candidatus Methylomirabilis sp.]|nr:cache domain-containing protein [Candidatus Methylomirabilis sp.]